MADAMVDRSAAARSTAPASSPTRALALATISFALSFAAWGLVGGLAPVFTTLYSLSASQTALLVAVPVLLGSLARLPMGMLTDRLGGRLVFAALLAFSSLAAFVVPWTTSYASLLLAAFLGVVQVRRTMGPLVQLTAATRAIAARRFGTRVEVGRDDEFGALAFDVADRDDLAALVALPARHVRRARPRAGSQDTHSQLARHRS